MPHLQVRNDPWVCVLNGALRHPRHTLHAYYLRIGAAHFRRRHGPDDLCIIVTGGNALVLTLGEEYAPGARSASLACVRYRSACVPTRPLRADKHPPASKEITPRKGCVLHPRAGSLSYFDVGMHVCAHGRLEPQTSHVKNFTPRKAVFYWAKDVGANMDGHAVGFMHACKRALLSSRSARSTADGLTELSWPGTNLQTNARPTGHRRER